MGHVYILIKTLSLFLLALSFNSSKGLANVVGPDTQNFNVITSGVDFLTVQSSEPLNTGIINLGFFTNYAVNSLPIFEDAEDEQGRTKYNDALLMTDFNIGYGLFKNLEIGFSYPRVMYQDMNSDKSRGQFAAKGNTELRFMTKYRFSGNNAEGMAVVLSMNINRILNNPYVGIEASPGYNIEFAGDKRLWGFSFGLNLGYRFRNPGKPIADSPILPTDDQVIASIAASHHLSIINTKFIAEVFGSLPAQSANTPTSNRQAKSLELIGGIKHDLTRQLAWHVGAGTELISGVSSPDWRIYAGLNWVNGQLKAKKAKSRGRIKRKTRKRLIPDEDPLLIPPEKGRTTITLDAVQFEFDSYFRVLPGTIETLGRLAQYLKQPPAFKKLYIDGHTDSFGDDQYNLELSIKRAWTIRDFLVQQFGLDASKIKTRGFGERKPIEDNGNFQGRQSNRRVEFIIIR